MSTHNLCFGQKSEKYKKFLSENFQFLVVKFSVSVYLNRCVFVMIGGYTRVTYLPVNNNNNNNITKGAVIRSHHENIPI